MSTTTESVIGRRIGTSDGLFGVIVNETKCYYVADVVVPEERDDVIPPNRDGTDQIIRMRIHKSTGNHYAGISTRWFYWAD